MPRAKKPKPEESTRDRILAAAIAQFGTHSYEATGLRDIAAKVGVDVAYVHRCFGSKEQLFEESVKATLDRARNLAKQSPDDSGPVDGLVRNLLRPRRRSGNTATTSFDIVIRSLSSPEAARVLRERAPDFITPLAKQFKHESEVRAALAMAVLTGIGILKDVIGVTALTEADAGELAPLVGRILEDLLEPKATLRQR
jgi:AcrR family transcriptional regulator